MRLCITNAPQTGKLIVCGITQPYGVFCSLPFPVLEAERYPQRHLSCEFYIVVPAHGVVVAL